MVFTGYQSVLKRLLGYIYAVVSTWTLVVPVWKFYHSTSAGLPVGTLALLYGLTWLQEDTGVSRRYQSPDGGHNVWGCAQMISLYYIRAYSPSVIEPLRVLAKHPAAHSGSASMRLKRMKHVLIAHEALWAEVILGLQGASWC